ncbi:hypothetical protein ACO1O0_002431 [Amphichorda felina]
MRLGIEKSGLDITNHDKQRIPPLSRRAKGIATKAAAAASAASSRHSFLSASPLASGRCRRFHTSRQNYRSDPSIPTNPWKAGDESLFEDDVELGEGQAGSEAIGGRSRSSAFGSRRRSQGRRRAASDLPAVDLPATWIDSNVYYYEDGHQPMLPFPLAMDIAHPKVSRLYSDPKDEKNPNSQKALDAMEDYFETAVRLLLEREKQLATDFQDRLLSEPSIWDKSSQIEKVVRIWDDIIDASWHLVDTIYPARKPEYTYQARPFWWWHIYRDLDPHTHAWRDRYVRRDPAIKLNLNYNEFLDHPLAHSIADFPTETFDYIFRSISRELSMRCPANFDPKAGKRPIQILSIHGYGGKSIAQSIMTHAAYLHGADYIHLDAYDISWIVGNYIGQDWTYSRGPLSTMGFRAAELGGRIAKEPEISTRFHEDDGDNDANVINVRASSSQWEDELSKIRQGHIGTFTDWENLKISKVLDSIINDPVAHRPMERPLILHVHDYVELSMTLEGSAILSKLRAKVDAAWKRGKPILLFATSACAQPSEEYQKMIQELGATDQVITRNIRPDRAENETGLTLEPQSSPFNLQAMDHLFENCQNINRMICALDPSLDPKTVPAWHLNNLNDDYWTHPVFQSSRRNLLNSSVLSLPEIYQLAKSFRFEEYKKSSSGQSSFTDRIVMGPLRQQLGTLWLDEAPADDSSDRREPPSSGEEAKFENHPGGVNLSRANEYEKRIANGIINRENLRTTFADVHVSPDTIGALKLLTSLALVRPDAFSYGVLAHDKINGCLLYGPPGTGKTMLAKAVAKESGANMLEISGASINDKWVGEAEKLIRAVFTLAKKLSPCVVFIDEADSLLANRSMYSSRASHREHINQFLKEWDGMEETNAFIMVATNRPFDLDDAVLRRLPRKLLVDLPLRDDRAAILGLLLRGEQVDPEVSLEDLADRTPYYSGSDLKNMCVAAAMVAVEEENAAASAHDGPGEYKYPDRRTLQKHHFERALKQIPASISEDMESLRLIRRFDEEYGNRRKGSGKKTMGFGGGAVEAKVDVNPARVRQRGS